MDVGCWTKKSENNSQGLGGILDDFPCEGPGSKIPGWNYFEASVCRVPHVIFLCWCIMRIIYPDASIHVSNFYLNKNWIH